MPLQNLLANGELLESSVAMQDTQNSKPQRTSPDGKIKLNIDGDEPEKAGNEAENGSNSDRKNENELETGGSGGSSSTSSPDKNKKANNKQHNDTHVRTTPGKSPKNSHKKGFSKLKKNSDESSDSEEESARDLKDRKVLEALERASNVAIRERVDQERVNRSFFHRSRNQEWKEQQAIMHALCEADLFNPPPLPTGFNLAECEKPEQLNPTVQVPGFSLVNPFIPYNAQYSRQFYDQYRAGYIHMYELFHDPGASPRDTAENGKGKIAATHEKEARVPFSKRVSDVFNLAEWSTEEVAMFEELLHVQGPQFEEISRLMCSSKTPAQIQSYFIDKWASSVDTQENKRRSTCHLCFEAGESKTPKRGPKSARLDKLIVCGGCERAYHFTCLNPRPISTTDPWYCSDECVSMSMLQCQLCGKAENDEQMLLCDTCDLGYHMFCLTPPLTDIPEGDWNCPRCTSPAPSIPATAPTVGCTHSAHHFIESIRSGGNPRAFKVPNTSFLELVPSVMLPYKPHTPTATRSLSSPAVLSVIPDKHIKVEKTETEPSDSTTGSPDSPSSSTEATADATKSEPADSHFIPPPPPPPPARTTRSSTKPAPSTPKSAAKSAQAKSSPRKPSPYSTPQHSPSPSPLTSPKAERESPALKLSTASIKFEIDELSDGEQDECMELDSAIIASSALPHSLLAIKHWGKEICIECLLQTGLLPGDTVFNKRSFGRATNESTDTNIEYQSIFAHPLISHKFNYKNSTLRKRFDAILAAVNVATQTVFDGKCDSNNHAHILPPGVHASAAPSSMSKKRGASGVEEGPSKLARMDPLASIPNPAAQQPLSDSQWWAFSFNPRVREVSQLRPQAQLEWQVRQYAEKMKVGDRVYIWVSGKQAGIYAIGTVACEPFSGTQPGPSSSVCEKIRVRIDEVLEPMLSKEVIEQDSQMKGLAVLRGPPGQINYVVSPRHADKLAKLIASRSLTPNRHLGISGSLSNSLAPSTSSPPVTPPCYSNENLNTEVNTEPKSSNNEEIPSPSPSINKENSPTPTDHSVINSETSSSPSSLSPSASPATPVKSNGIRISLKRCTPSPSTPLQSLPVKNSLISPTTHPPTALSPSPTPSLSPAPSPSTLSPMLFTNVAPIAHMISPTPISPPVPHTCYVCKKTDTSTSLQCLGCKDWYHSTCTIGIPNGTPTLLSWYCPPCASLKHSQLCVVCSSSGQQQDVLVCDSCSQGYHRTCIASTLPPSFPLVPRCWLCNTCRPSPVEHTNALLSIGWHELRNECSRIMSSECEYAHDAHRKAIVNFSKTPNRIYTRMNELTFNLAQLRQAVVAMAQSRYGVWAKAIVLHAANINPNCNSDKSK